MKDQLLEEPLGMKAELNMPADVFWGSCEKEPPLDWIELSNSFRTTIPQAFTTLHHRESHST